MYLGNFIELRAYLLERLVEIERPHAYLVAAHLVHAIRLDFFVGLCVEQHARYTVGFGGTGKLHFPVLHVSEDLVQVTRMDASLVKLLLHCAAVVLRVDDEDSPALLERYVSVHGGEHVIEAVIESPIDVRSPCGEFRVLAPVVLENELLVQVAHALLIEEVHHADASVLLRLEESLHDQPAHVHEHAVGLVVPVEAHVPVLMRKVCVAHVHEVR